MPIILGAVVSVSILAAAMVAVGGWVTRANSEEHGAAPRFGVQTVAAVPKPKVVVAPRHRASSTLLPVVIQDDILPRHQILADKVLRALPAYCRDNLRNFYVNYDKNAANRGLGGESTIIVIGTVPDNEFMALITHECGHVSDLGGIKGNRSSGASAFVDGGTLIYNDDPSVAFYQISWLASNMQQPNTKGSDFVSGYAASDPFEDFAEAFAYYALQQQAFAKAATKNNVIKAKYDFMQSLFATTGPVAVGKHVPSAKVPWDVTKLPYVWHAKK